MFKEIVRSILPELLISRSDAQRRRFPLKTLILHFRPASVPAKTLRLSLTWGLGGMAATLVLLQFATGILLKFAYIPTPEAAYESIQWIIAGMPFGRLVRNLHHWCSHLLVAVVVLHMLRVFFTGAFHPPRQFNWIIGMSLLAAVLAANFTGYLLPWDQLSYWAVTVSTGMLAYIPLIGVHLQVWLREGHEVGRATLQVFYSVHTAVVPAILIGLMAFHFWRVRKARGVVVPRMPGDSIEERPQRVDSIPDLLLREIVVALLLIAIVLQLAVFIDAPIGEPANPGLSPNPTRAPWYFAGLQELLLHIHPVFAVCIVPVLTVGALLLIPYLKYPVDSSGIWFASRIGRKTAKAAAIAGVLLTALWIYLDERMKTGSHLLDDLSPLVTSGLIPTVFMAGIVAIFFLTVRRVWRVNLNEAIQASFILVFSAFGLLTLVGVWFRGAGMELVAPW